MDAKVIFICILACLISCARANYYSFDYGGIGTNIYQIDENTGVASILFSLANAFPTVIAGSHQQQMLYVATPSANPKLMQVLYYSLSLQKTVLTVNVPTASTYPSALVYVASSNSLYIADANCQWSKITSSGAVIPLSVMPQGCKSGVVGNAFVSEQLGIISFGVIFERGGYVNTYVVSMQNGTSTVHATNWDDIWFLPINNNLLYLSASGEIMEVSIDGFELSYTNLTLIDYFYQGAYNANKNIIIGITLVNADELIATQLGSWAISTLPLSNQFQLVPEFLVWI